MRDRSETLVDRRSLADETKKLRRFERTLLEQIP